MYNKKLSLEIILTVDSMLIPQ